MGAKHERTKEYDEDVNDQQSSTEDKQKEINEMDDQRKDDDQIDPYHGMIVIYRGFTVRELILFTLSSLLQENKIRFPNPKR